MKITRAGDYALNVMVYIGSQEKNKLFMRNELSEICGIPDSFLGKILQSLAREGILYSERGKKGGFKLLRDPSEITLYEIIKAVEGDIKINDCLVDSNFCAGLSNCNIHSVLNKIRDSFIEELKKYTLENIIKG
ncbi:MAG: transcriptional regulator, BadM/Rrf2 family [Deferribacteraceae bacterium]|jgi:Rrf2 family protein|nr:transcriptional regulator, BadM/Rrf2 family [Deferribacteraceae bacterium]